MGFEAMDSTTGGDDNVFTFPKTAAERAALRKAKQDLERQRLVHSFVDDARALFHTPDGVAVCRSGC